MSDVLGLGLVGAGRFAGFLASAVADIPGLALRAVAALDPARARQLASAHGATAPHSWTRLLDDPTVDVVAAASVRAGRVLVVDHVLRYNPLLAALVVLREELLGPVHRFFFENDARDEDLPPGHWFWDEKESGGIFVEHGVHFFDAAHLLVGSAPESIAAVNARRPDGTTDLVSATAVHPGGALATHTHGFTHANRCERQTTRLDHGTAEVTVQGWIPLRARVEAWTDDSGAETALALPERAVDLLHVPGHRLGPAAGITAVVHRDAGAAHARGRGRDLMLPHRVEVLVLGGDDAKERVYVESVRAALTDLVSAARGGPSPRSGATQALAALAVADAARRSARQGRHVRLDLRAA